ncbi:copia protein [Tanacetum coccineum]|uniref:Copia protein n=1 Tax=Tanacetum coccineum TaxID=301880 RepID=A0ABQ5AMD9_9ASTR
METIHVKFDELTAMASEHDCLEPDLQRFNNPNSSDDLMNTPSKEDLDNLFGLMFEDYFERKSSDTTINSAAQPSHDQEVSPSTSSIIVDTHEAPPVVTTSDEQTSPISLQESDEFNQEDSADFDGYSKKKALIEEFICLLLRLVLFGCSLLLLLIGISLSSKWMLKKALYDLKQAPRAWYDKLSSFLIEHGFNKSIIDLTLFTRRHGGDILLVQVYVDDIIFGSNI